MVDAPAMPARALAQARSSAKATIVTAVGELARVLRRRRRHRPEKRWRLDFLYGTRTFGVPLGGLHGTAAWRSVSTAGRLASLRLANLKRQIDSLVPQPPLNRVLGRADRVLA